MQRASARPSVARLWDGPGAAPAFLLPWCAHHRGSQEFGGQLQSPLQVLRSLPARRIARRVMPAPWSFLPVHAAILP